MGLSSEQGSSNQKIHAYILAGGESSRFNGKPKGMQILKGKPLIQHVIDKLTPQTNTIFVNSHISDYAQLGLELIGDVDEKFQGPLAGLYACMKHAKSNNIDHFIITPCDSPFIPNDLIEKLSLAINSFTPLHSEEILASYIHYQDYMQPPYSLWSTKLLNKLELAIQEEGWGGLKIFIKSLGNQAVAVEYEEQEPNPFFNINCSEDLRKAEGKT